MQSFGQRKTAAGGDPPSLAPPDRREAAEPPRGVGDFDDLPAARNSSATVFPYRARHSRINVATPEPYGPREGP
jgi:hypothetical protein